MKLTRNEIIILIDYYENLVNDLENRMNNLKNDFFGLIDFDLYDTQKERYKHRIDEDKTRIKELDKELNKI